MAALSIKRNLFRTDRPKTAKLGRCVYTLCITLLLFSTLTAKTQISIGGDTLGAAYGFPLPWHMAGPTSLSRIVFVPPLLLSIIFYSVSSLAIVMLGTWITRRWLLKTWIRRILSGLLLLVSLATFAVFMSNFTNVEFWWGEDRAGVSYSGISVYVGSQFSRLL